MIKAALIAAAVCMSTLPAHAALSGYYDSAEQIQTILQSTHVADALKQLPIEEMESEGLRRDGAFKWEIKARGCNIDVYLRPSEPQGPGKTTYKVTGIRPCH